MPSLKNVSFSKTELLYLPIKKKHKRSLTLFTVSHDNVIYYYFIGHPSKSIFKKNSHWSQFNSLVPSDRNMTNC